MVSLMFILGPISDEYAQSVRSLATEFSPMSSSNREYTKDSSNVVADLSKIIESESPNSCFIQLVKGKGNPVQNEQIPNSVIVTAVNVRESSIDQDKMKLLVAGIALSENDRSVIEKKHARAG